MRITTTLIFILIFCRISAQSLYDISTIQQIDIHFSQTNWDYQLDTAKNGADSYIIADWVKVNAEIYDSVGVRYKGLSSYDSTNAKNPFHIKLDYIKGTQSYQHYTDLKLSNGYRDPSVIREALSYSILSHYMNCSQANFAQVYVNDTLLGLYTNVEDYNTDFLEKHFYSSDGTFVKCDPDFSVLPLPKANLNYISSDSSDYFHSYTLQSDFGWNDIVRICDSVTNNPNAMESILDVDKAIWMTSYNDLLVNLDSYSGTYCHNWYMYRDHTGRFDPMIWDLNLNFANFTLTGSGGLTTNAQKEHMTSTLHISDSSWPLCEAILNNPRYRKMYFAHMKTMNDEMFLSGAYQTIASSMQAVIDTAVQSDTNSFYSYSQFQNGMTQSVNGIIGITTLMQNRSTYLDASTDFQYSQPVISAITSSPSSPNISDNFSMNVNVTNEDTDGVFLGYRYLVSDKFVRIRMYDDGLHNDGVSGDHIYGISIPMNSGQLQYYIYAENNNAGIFSPARAEFEFHTLNATSGNILPGDVTINEFMAVNQNDTTDEEGKHEDWLELYNNSSQSFSLEGIYLSDDFSNPLKWQFPASAFILSNNYVLAWADNDESSINGFHTNFKLSGNGDAIIMSYANGLTIDSIAFGIQLADISSVRCPNGTGSFYPDSITTPDYLNDCLIAGIENNIPENLIFVYPNPASKFINVQCQNNNNLIFKLYNSYGELIIENDLNSGNGTIKLNNISGGIYFYQLLDKNNRVIKSGSMQIQY